MTLRLGPELKERLQREAEAAYPAECCGLLAGRLDGEKDVTRLLPVANARSHGARNRYVIEPEAYQAAEAALEREGLLVLGVYHSHPDAPPRPSLLDLEHAWPWLSYVIVQVDRGRAVAVASWVLDDDRRRFGEEQICP